MKIIALIAVIAIILVQWSRVVPQSSIGGPMTLALVYLAAALVTGVHEAWSKNRGVFGWIVSIVMALAGALVAAILGSTIMDAVLPYIDVGGSLAETRHPMLYLTSVAMMLLILIGSWSALWLINRVR